MVTMSSASTAMEGWGTGSWEMILGRSTPNGFQGMGVCLFVNSVLCSAVVLESIIQQHLSNPQMWVFNPVKGAGVYQQHTGCSFPSGWDCGENLYTFYLLRIKSIQHTRESHPDKWCHRCIPKFLMTFTMNFKIWFLFLRVDHRPPQAETSDPEMVSHVRMKQDRQRTVCTKNIQKTLFLPSRPALTRQQQC